MTESSPEPMGPNPAVPGEEIGRLSGTGVPVAVALHVLATSGSEEEAVRYLGSRTWRGAYRPLSLQDMRAAAEFAFEIVQRHDLPPPVAAAYEDWWRQRGQQITAERAKGWASIVLPAVARGRSWGEIARDLPPIAIKAALEYGSFVARTFLSSSRASTRSVKCSLGDLLSQPDKRLVDDFFDYWAATMLAIHKPTLETSLDRWVQLVERFEVGYDHAIEELINELDSRDILEDAIGLTSPASQGALREAVKPWNERFDAATMWIPVSLMGSGAPWKPRRWWWFRVPKQLGPELAADLRQAGIHWHLT